MKLKYLLAGASLVVGVLQVGCGGASHSEMGSSTPAPLSVQQVLQVAQDPSETSDPKPVVDGALALADVDDETSDPVSVG
jgi:hypothetical protein